MRCRPAPGLAWLRPAERVHRATNHDASPARTATPGPAGAREHPARAAEDRSATRPDPPGPDRRPGLAPERLGPGNQAAVPVGHLTPGTAVPRTGVSRPLPGAGPDARLWDEGRQRRPDGKSRASAPWRAYGGFANARDPAMGRGCPGRSVSEHSRGLAHARPSPKGEQSRQPDIQVRPY